jgi:hypothetical protein
LRLLTLSIWRYLIIKFPATEGSQYLKKLTTSILFYAKILNLKTPIYMPSWPCKKHSIYCWFLGDATVVNPEADTAE